MIRCQHAPADVYRHDAVDWCSRCGAIRGGEGAWWHSPTLALPIDLNVFRVAAEIAADLGARIGADLSVIRRLVERAEELEVVTRGARSHCTLAELERALSAWLRRAVEHPELVSGEARAALDLWERHAVIVTPPSTSGTKGGTKV